MRIEQLRYFVAIAQLQSFSLAAAQLHISQPSISQSISNLEEELGVKLFERSRSGAHLTKTGEHLVRKARNALNMIQDIYDEARAESESLTGSLRISSIPSICNAFFSEALYHFKKRHPQVHIEVNEDGTRQIIKDVAGEHAHLGIISKHPHEEVDGKLEFQRLLSGTYVACIGKRSSVPLYNPMPAEIIAGEPIVTFKSNYRQEEYLRQLLKVDKLNVLLMTGYTEAAKKLVADGIAIGFYPDFSVHKDPYVRSGEIIPVEIEHNDLMLSFGWIRPKSAKLTKPAQEFVKILKAVIDEELPVRDE